MKYFLKILPFFFVALTFASCGNMKPVSVSKIDNVKLKTFTRNSASLEVTMVINNPNRYSFKVVDNQLDLFMNKSEIGRVKIREKILIPRKSEKAYTFVIETEFSRLAMGSIPGLINMFQTKEMELKLVGDVKVRTLGIVSKRFPLEITEKVPFSRAEREKSKHQHSKK